MFPTIELMVVFKRLTVVVESVVESAVVESAVVQSAVVESAVVDISAVVKSLAVSGSAVVKLSMGSPVEKLVTGLTVEVKLETVGVTATLNISVNNQKLKKILMKNFTFC